MQPCGRYRMPSRIGFGASWCRNARNRHHDRVRAAVSASMQCPAILTCGWANAIRTESAAAPTQLFFEVQRSHGPRLRPVYTSAAESSTKRHPRSQATLIRSSPAGRARASEGHPAEKISACSRLCSCAVIISSTSRSMSLCTSCPGRARRPLSMSCMRVKRC